MKKILLAFSLIIIFASCSDNGNRIVLTENEYNQLINSNSIKHPKPFELVGYNDFHENNGILLGSDQHEYLVFNHQHTDETMMHYIDCELCVSRKQQEFDVLVKTLKDTINVQQ